MIYELSFEGHTLGYFPTEAEAVRRAGFLPKGRYTVREWAKDGDFSTFDPSVNKSYNFTNYDRENVIAADVNTLAGLIREYVSANCNGVSEGFEIIHGGYVAFIDYRADTDGDSITVVDVWNQNGNECPDIAEALQLLTD